MTRTFTAALGITCSLAAVPAGAQIYETGPLFDGDDAVVAGSFALATAAAFPLDRSIARFFQDPDVQAVPGLEPAAWVLNRAAVPGVFVLTGGLWAYGRIAEDYNVADVAVHMGQAVVLGTLATYAVKFAAGRARPALGIETPYDFELGRGLDDEEYRAFPSGHATVAFAAAAAAASELSHRRSGSELWIPLVTYGPAIGVAGARVFANRHWTSDVIAGAAIGSFAGWKVVQNAHNGGRSALDEWLIGASVVPGDWGQVQLFLLPTT